MYLKNINILGYKNIRESSLQLSPGINCFIGSNGEGKTNFLDAVYYLKVVSVPGKGMHITGQEQDFRSCFSEVSCGMYRDFLPSLHVDAMDALIYSHRQDFDDIRHAMLKIVRESKMRLRDIYTKKIAW